MSDLTRLTPTLQPQMRRDIFSGTNAACGLDGLIYALEKCDLCGAQVPLYRTTFTGRQFLCLHCTQHIDESK